MATDIYIVSGFLGAGKTTLIQKLIKEAFIDEKVVLIENDFGEISVDAALLRSGGVEVKEINSGCICCSLSGDFVIALKEILSQFSPDKIIIEPSGVGKLSDIVKSCKDPRVASLAKIKSKITVADVKRCKMYLDNFGEFFEDQIQNADTIVLSRADIYPDKIYDAVGLIKKLNSKSRIFSESLDKINSNELLFHKNRHIHVKHSISNECACGHHHEHNCDCGHDHSADEIFSTVTIHTDKLFSINELKDKVNFMEQNASGTILRAKGILRSENGYLNLQYIPGNIQLTKCTVEGSPILCIIGKNLSSRELEYIFSGEQ